NLFGTPQSLPRKLGDLPLYPDDNGFHSVNGPLDLTIISPHTTAPPVNNGNPVALHSSTNETQHYAHQYPYISSHDRQPSNSLIASDPVIRPERRSYFCSEPSCARPSPFPTRQSLTRHREAMHLNIRLDCPIPGCDRVGDNGIKRKDNLPAHVWNKHRIRLSREPREN
ncbi:unnamed protein product, partial [Tuber aestivum]